MARPLKPFVRSGGYYPSAKYTPLVYPGGYTTLNAKNGKPEPIDTFIGKIARFLAKRSLPMVKLEANFTPIQSLNGQEAPWPAGGWKNKYSGEDILLGSPNTRTKNVYLDTIPAGTYYFSCTKGGTATSGYGFNLLDENNQQVGSGSYATINSGGILTLSGDAVRMYVYMGQADYDNGLTLSITNIQIESGSTKTDYAPYSNICPISGHTGCEVVRNGVQQWDEEWELGNINGTTGQNEVSTRCIRSKNYIPVKPGVQYFFKTVGTYSGSQNIKGRWYDSSKNYIGTVGFTYNSSFTVPSNAAYFRFALQNEYGTTYNHDISINYPSTDHDYHAYTGTTVAISFGTTVYGGELTVFEDGSGQVVADRAIVSYPDSTGFASHSSGRWYHNGLPSGADYSKRTSATSNQATYSDSTQTYKPYFSFGSSGVYINKLSADETIEQFDARLQANPFQICYFLAEPVAIPLTASQINTLVGENVLFVNGSSGDITVQAYGTEIT